MKRALVIGASSGIGRALAEQLLKEGMSVGLVARRTDRMAELALPYPGKAFIYEHDVTHYDEVPSLFQQIALDLGGIDLVVYSSGVLPDMGESEYTFAKDRHVIEVNVLGAFAWLDEAARRFEQLKGGVIIGISSVAGERGRRANPAYCTSKAGLTTLLESLRNRLSRYGVRVLTIKPGFIGTPMIEGKTDVFWVLSVEKAAAQILHALRSGKNTAYIPGRWRLVAGVMKVIPSFVFRRLSV